jgi:hypothetical protein
VRTKKKAYGKQLFYPLRLVGALFLLALLLLGAVPLANAQPSGYLPDKIFPVGRLNGDFETGLGGHGTGPEGWYAFCQYSGSGSSPDAGYDLNAQYAHSGKFGCRIYASSDRDTLYNESWLCSNGFWDRSGGYSLWLKLADSGPAYFSGVDVIIADANNEGKILGFVRYQGSVPAGSGHHHGDVPYDKPFSLAQGAWKEYFFDFVADYIAKYKKEPGSLRCIFIVVYEDRTASAFEYEGTESCDVYVDDISGCEGAQHLRIAAGETTLAYTASGNFGSISFDTGWVPSEGIPSPPSWKYFFRGSLTLGWEPLKERWPLRYTVAWDPGKVYPGNIFPVYMAVKPFAPQQGAPESLISTIIVPAFEGKVRQCLVNPLTGEEVVYAEFSVSPVDVLKGVDVRSREKAPLAGEEKELLVQGDDVSFADFGIPNTPISAGYIGGRPEVKVEGGEIEVIYNLKLNGKGFESGDVRLTRAPSSWPPSRWSGAEPGVQVIWAHVPEEAKPGDKLTLNIAGFKLNAREYNRVSLTLNILGHEVWSRAFDWNQMGNSNASSPEINIDLGVVSAGNGSSDHALGVCRFRVGQNYYEAGGRKFPMDAAPYEKDGRTYVPVRYLANVLGVRDEDITWDQSTQKVTLRKGGITLYLVVGSAEMLRMDAATSARNFIPLDVAPEIVDGRVYLPARYVAESFGYRVEWEPTEMTVVIQGGSGRGNE